MKAIFIELNTERFTSEELTDHINAKLKTEKIISSTSCTNGKWCFVTVFCEEV
mgnify:CR=1 FL=1